MIGTGIVICPGPTIESGAIIGVCSVVMGLVRKNSIVAGNPAFEISSKDRTNNE